MSVLKSLCRIGLSRDLNPFLARFNLSPTYFMKNNFSCTLPALKTEELQGVVYEKGAKRHKGGVIVETAAPSELEVVDLDQLAAEQEEEFNFFPDENTPDKLFNGVKFKELPYVHIQMHKNNTKLIARTWDEKLISSHTPAFHGFTNAKKKTAVGGQVAGTMLGQKLRSFGYRNVRLRLNGFNQARDSTVKGLVQAGINIVAIQDSTTVNWSWPQRAKRRNSKFRLWKI